MLEIGESDFHHLKKDQSLLVDFNNFPAKLTELINLTLIPNYSENENNGFVAQNISFGTKLDQTTCVFSVFETNIFKQLTHISLHMKPGNDTSIKAYLASRLNFSISQINKLSNELELAKRNINDVSTQQKSAVQELHELK